MKTWWILVDCSRRTCFQSLQITWRGLLLYTFIKDTTPHTVNGNGVKGFVPAFVALQKKQ